MKFEKECIVCGKPFSTDNFNKTMCSRECQKARQKEVANQPIIDYCYVCGKRFEKARYSTKSTCGIECAKMLRAKNAGRPKKKSKLDKLVKEAKKNGITYGQLQAQKYIEEMRKATW